MCLDDGKGPGSAEFAITVVLGTQELTRHEMRNTDADEGKRPGKSRQGGDREGDEQQRQGDRSGGGGRGGKVSRQGDVEPGQEGTGERRRRSGRGGTS